MTLSDPVAPPWDTDGRLGAFLHETVFPAADRVRVIDAERPAEGGWTETLFPVVSVETGGTEEVLRVVVKIGPLTGPLAPYDVEKDALIFQTLADSDVPVPRLLAYSTDPSLLGGPFTVTEFVAGESPDIRTVERWPVWQQHREELGNQIIDTLAALQRFRWQDSPLADVLGPRGPASLRVRALLRKYTDPFTDGRVSEFGLADVFWHDVGLWLAENVPELDEDDLVVMHGDYRIGNLIWTGTEIAAVVDWERCALADPMADLGFVCMPMSRRNDPTLMGKALYVPELVRRYEQAAGRPVDFRRLQYYMILWQFEQSTIGNRDPDYVSSYRRLSVASESVIGPAWNMRATARLLAAYEAGNHDVF